MGMMKDLCDYREMFNVSLTIQNYKERILLNFKA
jgi:hypothetical protein